MLITLKKYFSYLLLSSALVAVCSVSAKAQTNANIKATDLIMGFSQLNSSEAGRNLLRENLETTLRINNQSTAAERQQAIYDNTTILLLGSLSNGLLAADALGPQLSQVYKNNNSVTDRYQVTTFSPNFAKFMSAMGALTVGGDSSFSKNYFANGSFDGNPDHQASGISLPSDGIFNVYDAAYNPLPENANSVGDSRPLQVAPDRVVGFDGFDYYGKPVNTTKDIFPGVSHNASFPSGHSATGFMTTMSMAMMVPERYKEMMLRGSEYGNSRIVLGVHYSLDVIGARIQTIYALTQALNNNPDYLDRNVSSFMGNIALPSDFKLLFDAAQQDLRALLNEGCGGDLTLCTKTTDGFAQSLKDKETYRYRLTYGLPTVGNNKLDPIVPEGAEILIANRFPYMSNEQLREVLATTEIQSGHALDNGSGYARLNLYDAADGYGAFNGLVTITMDGTKGGFNAYDTWGNNIADYVAPSTGIVNQGSFTKNGTGMLELYGDNSWSGTTTINGGSLIFTGNSRLAGAMINNSTLALTSINRLLPGHILEVGSYHGGQGSVLEMATSFGGDSSVSDMLHVTGNTSGTTAIRVMHTGGEGALTQNGIKLIEVNGASNANFTLANGDYTTYEGKQAIIHGIYGYSLYNQGGVTGKDGNWYLRSHYQPAVPVYESYGQALLDLNAVSTYLERAGDRYFFDPFSVAGNGAAQNAKAGSLFWGRIEGSHSKFEPNRSTSRADHTTNMFKMETGLDLLLSENSNGKLLGGIFVNYTNGSTKIDANVGDGKIKSDGYGIGANLTWIGENGFYVDGLAKMNWYNSDLDSHILSGLRSDNDGTGYALSIEAGRRFGLNNGWVLTPQAQLSWSSVDFDDFTGPYNVRVSLDKAESLTARIGLGFERETIIKNQDGSQNKSNFYAIANIYHDFADGVKVMLNDKAFENRNQRTWGGLTIGTNYSWNDDKYAIFGEGTVKTSLQDFADSYALKGSVGFKVKW